MWCGVLQCGLVYCSVVQIGTQTIQGAREYFWSVAAWYIVVRCVAVSWSVLQYAAVCCSVVPGQWHIVYCLAVRCSILRNVVVIYQSVEECCSEWPGFWYVPLNEHTYSQINAYICTCVEAHEVRSWCEYLQMHTCAHIYITDTFFHLFMRMYVQASRRMQNAHGVKKLYSHVHTRAHTHSSDTHSHMYMHIYVHDTYMYITHIYIYIYAYICTGNEAHEEAESDPNAVHIAEVDIRVQLTATRCNTLQHAATRCNRERPQRRTQRRSCATHCNTLQHTATHCNTLQHSATKRTTPCTSSRCCFVLQCDMTLSKQLAIKFYIRYYSRSDGWNFSATNAWPSAPHPSAKKMSKGSFISHFSLCM